MIRRTVADHAASRGELIYEYVLRKHHERERKKWLSGDTDVSMGMTIDAPYPGWTLQ